MMAFSARDASGTHTTYVPDYRQQTIQEAVRLRVKIAYDLATTYDDTLIIMHVIPTDDYKQHKESIRNIPEFRDFSIEQEVESTERFVRKFVTESIDDFDNNRIELQGRIGNIAEEIISETDRVAPRYLVISGWRRSPTGESYLRKHGPEGHLECRLPSRHEDGRFVKFARALRRASNCAYLIDRSRL